jgi:hypothetical protein
MIEGMTTKVDNMQLSKAMLIRLPKILTGV